MDISVIICTHNRAEFLKKCLHATVSQVVEHTLWEIVVVANACTDHTVAAARSVASTSTRQLRLIEDPMANLSHARNLGASEAKGKMLIYLDDDAQPAEGWLAAYADHFRSRGDVQAGGGPIQLDWGTLERPAYWRTEFDVNLSGLVLDPPSDMFPPGLYPFGANMFMSAEAFRAVGGFHRELGMHGSQIGLGEETDWFIRHATTEGKIGYVPQAIVHHWVNPRKLTRANLRQRAWQAGIAAARLHGASRETRGLFQWARYGLSGALRGRLVLTEQLYLLRWLGQLWGQRSEPRQTFPSM